MSETRNWRRGTTLNTSRTNRWTLADRQANDRIEQTMIFSDFHDSDEGRSRQLVCTLNPQHPKYEANAAFIVRACNSHDKLLAACKSALWYIENVRQIADPTKDIGILKAAIREAEKE